MTSSPTQSSGNRWRTWDSDTGYGDTLYRRATGALPEMESSKAAARRIAQLWTPEDTILDVGCGAGHYLVSLRKALGPDFDYVGADATAHYLELASKAFANDPRTRFEQADIFALPFANASFDVVTCNNVLLHLPSVATPLAELVRVARKTVIVRLLCGERTMLIQDVRPSSPELGPNGEPQVFNHFNIYSEAYIAYLLSDLPGVTGFRIEPDRDFVPEHVQNSAAENDHRFNSTRILNGYQINGYVLQPWAFLTVEKATS